MTAPEGQNGLREALARAVWEATLPFQQELLDCGGVTFMGLRNAVTDALIASPLASLIAERDPAVATVAEVEEWTGSRDGWPSLKAKMDLIVIGAEKAEDRHDAEEARANAIQATLDAEMEIQAEVRASLRAAEAEITRLKEGMEAAVGALHTVAGRCELARSVYATEQTATPNRVAEAFAIIRDTANRTLATLSPKEHPHG